MALNRNREVWLAYQLDRTEKGDGLVVALRRPDSPYQTARLVLHGLEVGATYVVTDLDTGQQRRLSGNELAKAGLEVAIGQKPGSALLTYRRE